MSRSLKALIVSAHSMGNIGDNVISLVHEGLVSLYAPEAEVRHAVLNQNQLADVLWADVVIVGGGGILYDWSLENVDNYLRYIDMAKYAGKPAIVSGVGVQGIRTEYGKRRYKETLNTVDCLIVRDSEDAAALSKLGVSVPIQTLPDLAMLLPELLPTLQATHDYSGSETIEKIIEFKKSSGKPLLGVSISSEEGAALDTDVDENEIKQRRTLDEAKIRLLRRLEPAYSIVLMPHSRDDLDLYNRAAADLKDVVVTDLLSQRDNLGVFDAYQCFDTVITSRYHGFLLGALTRKPMAVLMGVNTSKIQKTIKSQLPSYLGNVIDIEQLDSIGVDNFSEYAVFDDSHDSQINRLIDTAAQYKLYIGSTLDKVTREVRVQRENRRD